MRTRLLPLLVATLGGVALPPAAAQNVALYDHWNGLTGFLYQNYSFDQGLLNGVKTSAQWAVPVVVVAPLGRGMSLDLTTNYAHSTVSLYSGQSQSLSGFTDTQVRWLYTLGRDRAVTSLSVNLPTGVHFPASDLSVSGSVGSNFLSYPVTNYGTGFGVTGGAAYAARAGSWNLGLAGSLRYLATYKPFSDSANQAFKYTPGMEGRIRGGADRLIGQGGHLVLGLTYSTFSTDTYAGSVSFTGGWYDPGSRFIGELGYAHLLGKNTLTFAAWDYYRLASGASVNAPPKENIFDSELRFGWRATTKLQLEPLVGFRQWSPADYRGGRLYTVGANARYAFAERFSGQMTARYGPGWVYDPTFGRADLHSTTLYLLLRYQY